MRSPTPLYDGTLVIESGSNKVVIDFTKGTVTANGKTDAFIPEKR